MYKTKIEWCDASWNPITGCLHNCEYCYARKIANRFGGSVETCPTGTIHELEEPFYADGLNPKDSANGASRLRPYPYMFDPTFHKYRLADPQKLKKPRNIFVCSMADLFGDWVPDEWIKDVLTACYKASQHNYLFLTKNPKRYEKLYLSPFTDRNNIYCGFTVNKQQDFIDALKYMYCMPNMFVSIEPIMEEIQLTHKSKPIYGNSEHLVIKPLAGTAYMENTPQYVDIMRYKLGWVIIGAETGNRKGKVIPKKEWINDIVSACKNSGVPVFMKNSLIPIVGEENMRREFPEGLKHV